ncbi:hypothetical protein LTR16_000495 [Cryomyces antarcticus]|uniref:Nudix hydrolase domain-containing protein n=1 Tax=Cryomyces antarcticus TaxID=329879 RepID=A0ABR0KUK1_9PEZI|nr:hypothetical protein LTR16_000495 [Cryomyces antarcticus]
MPLSWWHDDYSVTYSFTYPESLTRLEDTATDLCWYISDHEHMMISVLVFHEDRILVIRPPSTLQTTAARDSWVLPTSQPSIYGLSEDDPVLDGIAGTVRAIGHEFFMKSLVRQVSDTIDQRRNCVHNDGRGPDCCWALLAFEVEVLGVHSLVTGENHTAATGRKWVTEQQVRDYDEKCAELQLSSLRQKRWIVQQFEERKKRGLGAL